MSQSNKLKIDSEKCSKYKSNMISKIPVALYPLSPLYTNRWKQASVQTIFRSDDLQKYCNSIPSSGNHKKLFHMKGWPFLTANLDQKKVLENQKDQSKLDLLLKNVRPEMKDVSVSVSYNPMPSDLDTEKSKDIECLNAIEKYETDIQELSTTNRLLKLELRLLTDFINLGYEALNVNNIVDIPVDGKIATSYKLREIVLTCVQYCKSHGKRLQELKEMEKKYQAVQNFLASSTTRTDSDEGLDQIEGDLNSSIPRDEKGNRIKCNTADVGTEYSVTFESASISYYTFQSKTKSKTDITDTESDMADGFKDKNELTEYSRLKKHVVLVKTLVEEQEAMVRELSDLADELGAGIALS